MSWLAANLAPIMFAALLLFLLTGFPVAFGLAATGMTFGWIAVELGVVPAQFFNALPLRLYGIMSNDVLLAIPFFTFMGLILERSRMAEDLLETIGQVFGSMRSGLAIAVELGLVPAQFFNALPLRLYGIMSNDVLLAIPFFTFMGLILERSRMA